MSISRSGFFSPTFLNKAYSLIGGHFPYTAYIGGLPIIGKLWDLFSEDGRGLDRIVTQAAQVANENNGLAWWRFGPMKDAVLVVKPEDIQAIIHDNHNNLILHDSTGSFIMFFGPDNIFNMHVGSDEWKNLRSKFLKFLFVESTLKQDVAAMQSIIDSHTARISESLSIQDLDHFCGSLTMDMIGLKLGLLNIKEELKCKVSKMISEGAVEVANPWTQVVAPYIPGYDFKQTKLYKIMQDGREVILDIIRDNEATMRSSTNWLNREGDQDKDYLSQESLYDITQFLVVGHETTAKLLLMSILLLADPQHHAIFAKLRAEIDAQVLPPEQWTRDTIKKMSYMEAVMSEVLRLYPPIPDMIFKIKNGFTIADGTAQFKESDLVIISQRTTGWSKQVWGEDAAEFKPERFIGANADENKYKYFPFGFAPKHCVGQLFSKQEVALTLARLINNFDFRLDNQNGQALQHPFPFHQVFTLRIELENIAMHFERRMPEQTDKLAPTFRGLR